MRAYEKYGLTMQEAQAYLYNYTLEASIIQLSAQEWSWGKGRVKRQVSACLKWGYRFPAKVDALLDSVN